ncbi:DUF3320 domain-containing protein [Mesorhizobium sp. 1B3]|uniref:DUF3320 domain-containing protein n=1 Tax=Mesorhizobium sp. 1B3 TaxID=3243599 RepID=UPI003D961A55
MDYQGGAAESAVRQQLLADRKNLLDLGTRNRLINVPLRSNNIRTIEIVDEKATEVYRLLVEGKGLTFVPGRQLTDEEKAELGDADAETGGIPQPDENEEVDDRGISRRHSDNRLQTRLTSQGLQKRLFDIWYDARTLEEEQGVNILYLAIGLLRWFESETSDVERHAPLVLLPVRLDRTSAADRFTLRWRGEPASSNLSLQAKMNAEFGLKLPDIDDEEEFDIAGYIARVAETVSGKGKWDVRPDGIILGFFSFAKFLMYRDLDPDNWPADKSLDQNPVINSLLREGFPDREPIVPDSGRIDAFISPEKTHHVVEADSSQTVVIEEVSRGGHLVVKGPPGTGKSQTITNIIAAAAEQGRKVLFVAEKMAALDVVHRRLKDAGLGPLTLELHSNKTNKRALLEELRKTKDLARRVAGTDATVVARLKDAQNGLNSHADAMHKVHEPSGMTPYQLIGHLVRVSDGAGLHGFALTGPEHWSRSDYEVRLDVCKELTERFASIGQPVEHAWYGVRRDALDPAEIGHLGQSVEELLSDYSQIQALTSQVTSALKLEQAQTFSDLVTILDVAKAVATMPVCDRRALADPIWQQPGRAAELVEVGTKLRELRESVDASFLEVAWTASLGECRSVLATKGGSIFRLLSGRYRSQVALLRSYLKQPLPKDLPARLALIDMLLAAQEARRSFEELKPAGTTAFGSSWNGERSNWDDLRAVVEWHGSNPKVLTANVMARVAELSDLTPQREIARDLSELLTRFVQGWTALQTFLDLDLERSVASDTFAAANVEVISRRLYQWHANIEAVTKWVAFHGRCRAASSLGLESLVEGILSGQIADCNLIPTFDRSYFEAMRADFFAREPGLKRFDGELHTRLVDTFRRLEVARMSLAREQIATRHATELPRSNGGIGPLGVLNGELAKKRNHLPIRQLLDRAGPAIQQIKPIFMMSPLSVAQFLKPGTISFDLLVVDEASQVEPVDALGAIARSGQIVVVGDERQLPPTRFFSKLTSDIDERDEDDEVTFQARDAESILDLCLAKGMPFRMLNWHYRSKHQSLIAVSNREFYDNRLFIVPSPYDAVAGMGLKFNYLPHAHYDRGNTRTNPVEAKAVAEAVVQHAKERPEISLGVATFSVAQRQAILKELELLRRAHPETEDFFNRGSTEPFFVKNLENIQGDERDVIFISVGYGKTSTGYMAMSFGPLNSEGGERRLNVLISRAKLRCEVFSSITGDDIDLERVRSRGVAALKLFLTFAQTGKFGFAEETGNGPDSVFEEQVADKLRSLGCDVKTQIGSAGFFVDLAVSDPDKPGRFVLGIECDGAQYHSSRSARDRDRLRQRVLEDHGWIIHRIWSTDWYLRPNEELAKVTAAIEAAKAEWRTRDDDLARPRQAVPLHFTTHHEGEVDILTAHVSPEERSLAIPYEESSITVRMDLEPHEVSIADMARYVGQIVSQEGPIHESEIVTRVRSAWGLARAGNRIRDAVLAGIKAAEARGEIEGEGAFYVAPKQEIRIRDRSGVSSLSLRPIAFDAFDAPLMDRH